MDAQEFITKKYEHNNWGLYPPSRRLVGEWLEEFAKEYHTEQLRLGAVVGQSEQFVCRDCEKPSKEYRDQLCEPCHKWHTDS